MKFMLLVMHLFANECFLIKENNTIIQQSGYLEQRYAPMSTFKIPLALIGYDAKILEDEKHPVWPFQEGYADWRDVWKQDHDPKSWMLNSCVWYSQVLTTKLGIEKFQDYVTKFNYGNMDISGDKGKDNGLTKSWLSSSLQISANEQALFLEKLVANKLPVSKLAHDMSKKILFVTDLKNGWKLYGKTGMGENSEGIQHGWFIGWIEKEERKIIFVKHISDTKKEETYASFRAKEQAIETLQQLDITQ